MLYILKLKTQNYHWNVESKEFRSLHLLFEEQYEDLAEALDEVAERIRMIGAKVATLTAIIKHSSIKEANPNFNASDMLKDLIHDQEVIVETLCTGLKVSQGLGDEGTADIIINRIKVHEKNKWMLKSSL